MVREIGGKGGGEGRAYVYAAAGRDGECAFLTPFELGAAASRVPSPNGTFPIPAVPDFDRAVLPGGGHIPPAGTGVYGHACNRAHVGKQTDGGVREIGRPEGDGAVLVPEVYDGIVGVLTHSLACT